MEYFKNKTAWITGASSGIGRELAIQLAKNGASVILSARNESNLNELHSELIHKEKHMVLPMDLEKNVDFSRLVEVIIERYKKIDFLFNNGGVSQRSTISETSLDVDRRIMEINYFGNIMLTKLVLPFMKEQGRGHVVVTSSISGKFGFFLRSAYAASKHALHGFYESLILEEPSINVTLVCPGKINTPISTHALTGNGNKHGVMDHNQETGMTVETCVNELLHAVQKKKKEVLIGNKEVMAVKIKRFFPGLFWKIIRKQKAT